jgi:hypothetical protein
VPGHFVKEEEKGKERGKEKLSRIDGVESVSKSFEVCRKTLHSEKGHHEVSCAKSEAGGVV